MLQSLELVGFKSFADRTRLEFSNGVTAVVGPNGSGKSNVVDAIKWVLGSQSAKSLRGGDMSDVIFSGSSKRAGTNSAEVTLTIDNKSGRLDFDAPQVALTRRVYRSGESEYLINRQPVRLRDIRDLLAGTGIGTEAYSIIEQGKVDALLQASPRDRRTIFEEAAGISRFRNKRVEALRRLQRVDQNLLRLADIVDEVETRLRSVRAQAGKAQSYREQVTRLEELRTNLGLADWTRLTRQLDDVAKQIKTIEDRQSADRRLVTQAEAHLPELQEQLEQIDNRIAQLDGQRASHREQALRSELVISKESQRIVDLEDNLARLREEWTAAAARGVDDTKSSIPEVAALKDTVERKRSALRQADENAVRQQRRHAHATNQHKELIDRLALLQTQIVEVEKQQDELKEKQASGEQQDVELRKQADALFERIPQFEQSVATSRSRLRHVEQRLEQLSRAYATAERLASEEEYQLPLARRRAQESATQAARLEQRIELLGEQQRQMASQQEQVASVFRSIRSSIDPATIADIVHVDVDIASMIEAALGAAAKQFVVEYSADELPLLSQAAAAANLRIAVVQRQHQTIAHPGDHVDLSAEPGVLGRADQFVDAEPEYLSLVRRLLGRTWLVDDISTALNLSSGTGRGLRFVSVNGEVVGADGTVELGVANSDWLMSRGESQHAQLQEDLNRVTRQHQQHEQALSQHEGQLTSGREKLRELTNERTAALDELDGARTQLATAENSLGDLTNQGANVATRLEQAQNATKANRAKQSVLTKQQQDLQQQSQQLTSSVTQLATAEREAEVARQQASERHRDAEIELARTEQELRLAQELASQIESQSPVEKPDYGTEIASLDSKRSELEQAVLRALARRNDATWHRWQIDQEVSESRVKRKAVRERSTQIAKALAETRKQLEGQNRQHQELQVKATRIDYQRQTLAERLRDDYEVDIARVAEEKPVVPLEQPRHDVEREIEKLRHSINRIGAVNSDALEELESIEKRYEEISSQYNDLSTAKESLEKIIAKLNGDSRKLFFDTVDTVREHFRELFRRLFGGGEADIVLESATGDDPLECGIEIQASPPGKETRNISLLSGGEKTLTCVALLLAMFRSKPSPFCLLDEVDAALDESNIGRFTKVLRDFLSDTQFIVITHSKKTMVAADTLYGITMQESGVSKQVSVRFDEVDEHGNVRPNESSRNTQPPSDDTGRIAA